MDTLLIATIVLIVSNVVVTTGTDTLKCNRQMITGIPKTDDSSWTQVIKDVFNDYDCNGDRRISVQDLKMVGMNDINRQNMLWDMDTDGSYNQQITLDEFSTYIINNYAWCQVSECLYVLDNM